MSVAIGISCIVIFRYRFSCPECPLFTQQTEFSSSFVFSPSVRTVPDILYGAFLIIGISCYRYLLYRNRLLSIFLSKMPSTYTTDRILLEFCVLTQRPDNSRHSLWAIFNPRYLLWSISLSERPECPLPTPQQEFSPRFVSSPSVRTTPDNPYGLS